VHTTYPSVMNPTRRREAKKKLKTICQDVLKCTTGYTLEERNWHPASNSEAPLSPWLYPHRKSNASKLGRLRNSPYLSFQFYILFCL